jgi:hypothetical protein
LSDTESSDNGFSRLLEVMEKKAMDNITMEEFNEDIDLMLKLTDKALFALDKLEADITKLEMVHDE